tara:strand:+ start:418 stop:879 length:462 start_codon:yes stop_codon:yes gene_type:complete
MIKKLFFTFLIMVLVSGCVNTSQTPDIVNREDVQKEQYVIIGTILDITKVTIEGDREIGAAAGALIGGAAGKNVTDSETESAIASLLGGLIGSAVGSEIGSNMTKKDAVELLIETNNGKLISIIQEASNYNYNKNQKVRIIKRNGKSRVIPFD